MLILGGGDGALMKELFGLAEPPAYVTMVDIDAMVMDACNQFMPTVAGNYMARENWEGENYKVIAGDAIAYMKNCMVSKKFFYYLVKLS